MGLSLRYLRWAIVAVVATNLSLTDLSAERQWVTSLEWTAFVPSTAISFSVSTRAKSYSVRDRIVLDYRILNVSNKALYVPRFWLEGCPFVEAHVNVWLEDSIGRRSPWGVGGSCPSSLGAPAPTVTERMAAQAVLLKPGEHVDGTAPVGMPTLAPGAYRIEAVLHGWKYDRFSDAALLELAGFGFPFLRGESPASVNVTLTE